GDALFLSVRTQPARSEIRQGRRSRTRDRRAGGAACAHLSPNQSVAIPRNEKKLTISVTVVTKGPDDTAGSTPSLVRPRGMKNPPSAADVRTQIIASDTTKPRLLTSSQTVAMAPRMTAKQSPFTTPTMIS